MSKLYKVFSFLILITIGVKFVDVVRSLLIAGYLGTSGQADIYMSLIYLPEGIVVLLGLDTIRGVINSEFSHFLSINEDSIARESFTNLFNVILFFSLILLIIVIFAREHIINLILPGFDNEKKALASNIALLIFPVFFFKTIMGMFQAILNASKRFYLVALAPILISLSVIAFIFVPQFNNLLIYNLSYGNFIGNLLATLLLFYYLVKNQWKFNIFKLTIDPLTLKVLKNSFSLLLLVVSNQLFILSRNFFASYLEDGAISALNYASYVNGMISTLIFASIFSALVSNLSTSFSTEKLVKARNLFYNTLITLIYCITPIIGILIIYSKEILSIIYLRGNFDAAALEMTIRPFFWETLSIFGFIFSVIPTSLYLAKKKYKTLTIVGSSVYLLGIGLNFFLSQEIGYYGISMGAFITTFTYGLILIYKSRNFIGKIGNNSIRILTIICCGFICFVIVMFLKPYFTITIDIGNLNLILNVIIGFVVLSGLFYTLTAMVKMNYLMKIKNLF